MRTRSKFFWPALVLMTALLTMTSVAAYAAVSTDQSDYAPGSVVTISGDNSNGAGYAAFETVHVDVSGPNGYQSSCEGAADENGAWSCQVTLWDSLDAVGIYAYTATGLTSGATESGTFTDAINVGSFDTATCGTPTSSFASGTEVCGKVTGLPGGGGGTSGKIEWVNPSSSVVRSTPFTGVSGNFPDRYTPTACGTWTLNAYAPASTLQATSTFAVTGCVTNHAPTVTRANATVTVGEGTEATNNGTWGDQDAGDTVTLTASVGTIVQSGTNTTGTWTWSYTPADGPDDTQTVTITANDTHTTSTATFSLVVNNVKPTPAVDSISGNSGAACIGGNTVTLGFSWTDAAGTNDTYSYDVNWGDGNHTKNANFPTADLAYGASPVTGLTHNYAAGGPYTIAVTVNDSDANAGNTASSAPFSFLYNVTGVLQPVNDTQAHQDPSIFKWGSTIPVKIEVTDCHGTPVSGLSPMISVTKVNPNPPPDGFAESTTSTSAADTGTTMRWSDPLYIYNLATKPLTDGTATYKITITGPFTTVIAYFGLKTK
jgi:hypothetical protein